MMSGWIHGWSAGCPRWSPWTGCAPRRPPGTAPSCCSSARPASARPRVVEEAVARAAAAGSHGAHRAGRPGRGRARVLAVAAAAGERRRRDCRPDLLDAAGRPTGESAGGGPVPGGAHGGDRAARDVRGRLGRLVLVLEDLHWADAAVARPAAPARRDIADGTRLAGDRHRPATVPARRPAGAAEVLHPGHRSSRPRSAPSWRQQADGAVHGSWAGVVHRLGGGNPLYTRELARLLARDDRLRRPGQRGRSAGRAAAAGGPADRPAVATPRGSCSAVPRRSAPKSTWTCCGPRRPSRPPSTGCSPRRSGPAC